MTGADVLALVLACWPVWVALVATAVVGWVER